MRTLHPARNSILVVAYVVFLMLIAAACGGERPTLTSDALAAEADTTNLAAGTDAALAVDQANPPQADPGDQATTITPGESAAEQLTVQVLETFPHDPQAFTQGLEVDGDTLIESTGLRFESDLRRVELATGDVVQIVATPSDFFAEGLTRVGDELVQITWQDQTAFFWNAETFELNRQVSYTGEGWGLCYDGSRLVMTDGTPTLIFRDPTSFDETGRVPVTLDGLEVFGLNETECVGGYVWANIWRTDIIVRIDPATGVVDGVVDASTLEQPRSTGIDVLNGIAWDDQTQTFLLTGKLWPTMYRVNFVPAPGR